ncbi:MAG: hypothetical protein RMJ98_01795 [Myxococcales bacterium]|nr:hypothetical protein [Polyangiaceae bacterium]MDW8248020.1 hypothetical protein [Myxococcales bacterium]
MRSVGWALAAAMMAGCGHTETHRVWFQEPPEPPLGRSTGAELYLGVMPSRPFVEHGLVQAIGYGEDAREKAVLEALRKEGTRQGCDAVVKVRFAQGLTAAHAVGVCVRWSPADKPR